MTCNYHFRPYTNVRGYYIIDCAFALGAWRKR